VICAELVLGSMAAIINVATRHRTTRDKRGMTDSLLDVKNVQSTTITSVVMAIGGSLCNAHVEPSITSGT
jgi:hypothetical protein